jgi:hypothetical protein
MLTLTESTQLNISYHFESASQFFRMLTVCNNYRRTSVHSSKDRS